jgi:hypothetical protein
MIGPSLANGSPACMTESAARAKFPKAHLVWVGTNHWHSNFSRLILAEQFGCRASLIFGMWPICTMLKFPVFVAAPSVHPA